jgi:hypothetical protein
MTWTVLAGYIDDGYLSTSTCFLIDLCQRNALKPRHDKNEYSKMINLSATNPFQSGSQEYIAYQRAYDFASANRWVDRSAMCGRVIGHMLRELPWDRGRSKLASEVNSCADDESLLNLGNFYIKHFLRACEWDASVSVHLT